MKIHFDDITVKPRKYRLDSGEWSLIENGDILSARAQFEIRKNGTESVVISGALESVLNIPCCRCGTHEEKSMESQFEYFVTIKKEVLIEQQEMECPDEDVNTLYLRDPEIDLQEVLREQMILTAPIRMLCSEDCKGICSGCGANLNTDVCTCSTDNSDSPFSVLSRLKK
jgi:uncharacterized protein